MLLCAGFLPSCVKHPDTQSRDGHSFHGYLT
ncbi:hypothetical protein NC651_017428 [Populus alba x Populus x berolinensis]|nr:hypothetical protein NC651_017428 [Populus alba x Populus x berolinensis]